MAKPSRSGQSQDSLYLDSLQFDQSNWRLPIAPLIKNVRLVALLLLTLVLAGVFSFISLPRELNPEVDIPIVTVSTSLPGADPLDVEELVTKPLERELAGLDQLDTYTSSSTAGRSTISLQFVSSADTDEVLQDVTEQIDLVNDLPEDATTPLASKLDFNDTPVWRVALVGELDPVSFEKVATDLADDLEDLNPIDRVEIFGQEETEIVVALTNQALQIYSLTSDDVTQLIQASNNDLPAGTVETDQLEYQVTVTSAVETIDDLRQLPIRVGGESVVLGDVAQVYERSADTNTFVFYGRAGEATQPAVELEIYKTDAATIDEAVEAARGLLDTELAAVPQLRYESVIDVSADINDQFNELGTNLFTTVLLVFGTLLLFLGFRQATIASLSIPLTFLSTFIIMNLTGISLNFLSLFSLLLALGLVVDDAIVIVQSAASYGKKFSPTETGLLVFKDFVVPIWSTTLTTVWAFLPLLLATGIIGEFIRSIPIVVSATLISSTTIAVLINIPLTVFLAKLDIPRRVQWLMIGGGVLLSIVGLVQLVAGSPLLPVIILGWVVLLGLIMWSRHELLVATRKVSQKIPFSNSVSGVKFVEQGVISFAPINYFYSRLLRWVISKWWRRWATVGFATGFFILGIVFVATGLTQNEFFPSTDEDEIFIDVEGPAGWQVDQTLQAARSIEQELLALPEVEKLLLQTGQGAGESGAGPNRANFTLVLTPALERERGSVELAEFLRQQLATRSEAIFRVVEAEGGPPAGADLQVNITGAELEVLEQIANDFAAGLNQLESAGNVQVSLTQSAGQIEVNLNQTELRERGLTAVQVGGWLRTAITGTEVGSITIDEEEIDIIVTLTDDLQELSYLQNLPLSLPSGESYTLAEVADFKLVTSPNKIDREDGSRVVRVTAAARGVPAPELLQTFEQQVAEYDLPAGYSWDVGGANEENQESTASIFQAMGVSVILILITMVLQLGSFRKAGLVLMVIPLAVAGVLVNFTLLSIPLSFPALIGVLALFGIVVNNSIMLVEKISAYHEFGLPFVDGLVDACTSRVEAIFFTSLTTTIGLLPITIADPLWRGLGGAIIAGLSVSGLMILFVLPAVYVEVFGDSKKSKPN